MNQDVVPLYELINSRRTELGLSWSELARRCGYANTSKGLRRFDAIWQGNIDGQPSAQILARLPAAMGLGEETIRATVQQSIQRLEQTKQRTNSKAQAARRDSFEPSAYLVGTSSRPSQITIFGLTGGAQRWLRIPLDLTQSAATFAKQAQAVVRATPEVAFFGPTTGFIINYTPDVAVQFDTDGQPLKQLDHLYSPGMVSLSIGNRSVDANTLEKLLGMGRIGSDISFIGPAGL